MANIEDSKKDIEPGFTMVQRKNMKRTKPTQPIYRPGNGPLRKSNTLEDSESDTNLVVNSKRQANNDNGEHSDNLRYKSEGNSPRDRVTTTRNFGDSSGDTVFNDTRRPKKPEKMIYVPRQVAQAREHIVQSNSNSLNNINGNNDTPTDKNRDNTYNSNYPSKSYSERRDHPQDQYSRWEDNSTLSQRSRQASEPRVAEIPSSDNWSRTRDTRSVEPSVNPSRHYNSEKIQSKPPSGRRHSTIGVEYEERQKNPITSIPNFYKLAPRFQRKYLTENNLPEENWDGSSITFQGHANFNAPKGGSNYYQSGPNYNTLPSTQQSFNNTHVIPSGYHSLPNRARGRGRLQYGHDPAPGSNFKSRTPDLLRSPSSSRPQTPTGDNRRDEYGSTEHYETRRFPTKFNKTIPEEKPTDIENRDFTFPKQYQGYRGANEYTKNSDDRWNKRDDRENHRRDLGYDHREPLSRDYHDKYRDRDRGRETPHRDNQDRYRDRDRRDGGSRDFPDRYQNRDTPVRDNKNWDRDRYRNRDRGRDTPGRDNRGGGANANKNEFNMDKRRGDRRNGNRRSRSKDFKRRDSVASVSNRNDDYGSYVMENVNLEDKVEVEDSGVKETVAPPEEKVVVAPTAVLDVGPTHLNWIEEVELNDRLESGNLSDALTRSSSVTSLQDISTKSLPPPTNTSYQDHKKRNASRDNSRTRLNSLSRKNSTTSIGSRDDFKMPQSYHGRRRPSEDRYDANYESFHNSSRNPSRDGSWDRQRSKTSTSENWREEIVRSRQNSERETKNNLEEIKNIDASTKKAGVIVLPQQKNENSMAASGTVQDQPKLPETRRSPSQQKSLFDPNNPAKPIVIKSPGGRVSAPGFSNTFESASTQMYTTDQFGNIRPNWYDESTQEFQSCHYPNLLRDIKRADTELQLIIQNGLLLVKWDFVDELRQFLKKALEYLLCKSIKFCEHENIEQHIWKITYHNIIEIARKALKNDSANRDNYKAFLLYLIDEGTKYFENLVNLLEETFEFKVNDYLKDNYVGSHKGFVGIALVSAQKLFLYLGDLSRYKEEVNETSNYGKCRQWYIKSHEINPKNGKPYNQLALLAVYTKRKLDAVYYYMRSLMSSNPVPSAKEKLVELFYEIRKKYEQGEKKRREERLERQRALMKQKEFEEPGNAPGSLRKEIWIHPEGGRRVHRTTQATLDQDYSEEEDLESLNSVEVNKRFVISYLHVHGKLNSNIGMETFQETSMQMLKEFRALLQHSPVPLPCNRFLQLLALNMFAIESTQLKDPTLQSQPGYRSEMQERALIVSLQMFNLILERCVTILEEHLASQKDEIIDFMPPDADVLLPAIKIWCDWMLMHTNVWNPPPSTQDYRVGPPGDAWSRLATLMNLLEQFDQTPSKSFLNDITEGVTGFEPVRLPEDSVLSGFTPLMYTVPEAVYAPKELETDRTHFSLRLSKLLFFGTVYLCGIDPPVLKLEIEDGVREYVSVVCLSNSRDSPPEELSHNNEIVLESFSSEEELDAEEDKITNSASSEIRNLLTRKVELEKRKRSQELHLQRVKKILSQSVVSVHMEVRPKYLVPDTNCFIDHLEGIKTIAQAHSYTFMVPIVVLSELEGLSRGGKAPVPNSRHFQDPEHIKKVANASKEALDFLKTRHASVKCVTTKGKILPSTTFSTEDDTSWDCNFKNDDKILTTCLVLCKNHKEQTQESVEGEPRRLEREVVLLTEDRNLRVKAYARDVPVRELPDFMRWSALG